MVTVAAAPAFPHEDARRVRASQNRRHLCARRLLFFLSPLSSLFSPSTRTNHRAFNVLVCSPTQSSLVTQHPRNQTGCQEGGTVTRVLHPPNCLPSRPNKLLARQCCAHSTQLRVYSASSRRLVVLPRVPSLNRSHRYTPRAVGSGQLYCTHSFISHVKRGRRSTDTVAIMP